MNNVRHAVVCEVPVTLYRATVGVQLQYIKTEIANQQKRAAFYQRLGNHCLVEEGITGAPTSMITLDFNSVEEAMACPCDPQPQA